METISNLHLMGQDALKEQGAGISNRRRGMLSSISVKR